MATIDLNADLGETVDGVPTADDDAMFGLVSSANIACGGHAGDDASMRASVERARHGDVAVGAHPSFVDRAGFGRTAVAVAPQVLRAQVRAQIAALLEAGADVRYVKPHGALYHVVTAEAEAAAAVAGAVAEIARDLGRVLPLLGLGGEIARAAAAAGMPFVREAFLDRGYRADGSLVPRGEPGALLADPDVVAARAVALVADGTVEVVGGARIRTDAASLCVHGDSPGAVAMARAVRDALDAAGIRVQAPW